VIRRAAVNQICKIVKNAVRHAGAAHTLARVPGSASRLLAFLGFFAVFLVFLHAELHGQ
jgi:hypothetical protein